MEEKRHRRRRALGADAARAAATSGVERGRGGRGCPARQGAGAPAPDLRPLPLPLLGSRSSVRDGVREAPGRLPLLPLPLPRPALLVVLPWRLRLPPPTSASHHPPHCSGGVPRIGALVRGPPVQVSWPARPPSQHTLRPPTPRTQISQKPARPHSSPPFSAACAPGVPSCQGDHVSPACPAARVQWPEHP